MTEDQKNVLAVIERMTEAFHKGDIEGVMASYEDTATIVFEPGNPVSGPAVLRELFLGMFTMNPRFDYSGHEVVIAGDLAVHFAPWTMKGTSTDGAEIKQDGLSVAVLRKQTDGRWRMVIDNPHGQRLMDL
ncbi:MAG: SgcJ/EcaC family oxidoreductase [Proteobacteria bacterium]|nr:SgcJ/EcaC family oxidoreductase [Pseudomonadota bacterium]